MYDAAGEPIGSPAVFHRRADLPSGSQTMHCHTAMTTPDENPIPQPDAQTVPPAMQPEAIAPPAADRS
jgi:hypothetical protein